MLVSLTHHSWAQEANHEFSSAPENVCYQIVQSQLGARWTFKIDKYNGKVFQLVKGKDGSVWQMIYKNIHTQDEITQDKVNYQIFTSALGARWTFLLNVNTGATWQLTEDKKSGIFWTALE